MNDYSYRDIMRMQEEAKARVMEMQRRSRFLAEDFAGGKPSSECGVRSSELNRSTLPQQRPENAECGMRNAEFRQGTGLSAALRNVFGNLDEEETEKMFLLALCLLLHQENGDEGLLMAMMYLLT